ncbi:hypothetical protein ABG768_022156 [Culter alburnus]|uniref:Uncharacterized protein n=1 Tax=Culter alburnus TaxID=194366 RepID=A0AAW2ANA5_CULAL
MLVEFFIWPSASNKGIASSSSSSKALRPLLISIHDCECCGRLIARLDSEGKGAFSRLASDDQEEHEPEEEEEEKLELEKYDFEEEDEEELEEEEESEEEESELDELDEAFDRELEEDPEEFEEVTEALE